MSDNIQTNTTGRLTPCLQKKIDKTTYLVEVHFSDTSTQIVEDKLKRVIQKKGRNNNRKQTFDAECRRICIMTFEPIVKTYYDSLEEGKILAKRCKHCGKITYPPMPVCQECSKTDLEWIELGTEAELLHVGPIADHFIWEKNKVNSHYSAYP